MNAKNILLNDIPGIGKKYLEIFHKENLNTAYDLMTYLPNHYDIYEPMTIKEAKDNYMHACLVGHIVSPVKYVTYRTHLTSLIFNIEIKEGDIIKVIIFNRQYLKKFLRIGSLVKVYGKFNKYRGEIMAQDIFPNTSKGHIDTRYAIKDIPSKSIRRFVNSCFDLKLEVEEYLPRYCLDKYLFTDVNTMLKKLHDPIDLKDINEARRRKKYEEVLDFYLKLNYQKNLRNKIYRAPIPYDINKVKELIKTIPFELTTDQKEVVNQVFKDFKKDTPLNRIIEGDVGSGKTIVSLIASYAIVTSGMQVVIMAPTEILANQHYEYFNNFLKAFDVNVCLFTGSTKTKERKEIKEKIKNNEINIIIGTHALFYEEIDYYNLGLAIIDEQHRFGVDARNKLLRNKETIDALYLSATPIPRTLSLTIFNDLDISVIKTVRSDKKPIITEVMNNNDLDKLFDKIDVELKHNHQGYVVVSSIESDFMDTRYDIETIKNLLELRFKDYRIGYLHGKMKDDEKNQVMNDFMNHNLDIIVSTTVIEVGISVDNATFIAILDAQNFGLSTMHQLRGRVGRAGLQGYCYLLADDVDIERIKVLEESNDGFYLAEMDLKMRGPGEYFGYKQSGQSPFVLANFNEDMDLFKSVNNDAKTLLLMSENDVSIDKYIKDTIGDLSFMNKLN